MKKKVIFAIVAAALLITGTIFVVAQKAMRHDGQGYGHGRGLHGGMGMFLRGLDLTDEQKTKVKEIMDGSKAAVEPLMQQMKDNHIKIADLGKDGKYDQSQVEAIAAEQGNLTAKLIVEKGKAKAQVFAILTDEQKTKAEEMRARFGERMKNGKGFGGKHGGMEF